MKRSLCSRHIHHLKKAGKSITLDSELCTICRWNKRPKSMLTLASMFERVSQDLVFCSENPDYDVFGFTYNESVINAVREYVKAMHPEHRDNFIMAIYPDCEW